jgi:hypothetical protein
MTITLEVHGALKDNNSELYNRLSAYPEQSNLNVGQVLYASLPTDNQILWCLMLIMDNIVDKCNYFGQPDYTYICARTRG